jgi:hypothetical protein
MEKTLTIDGKQVRFKSTGATPLRYKIQFQRDYFADIMKLREAIKKGGEKQKNIGVEDLNIHLLDFEVFYNIAWALAKTADPNIPEPLTWLDEFEEFPIFEIIPEIQDLLMKSLQSKKK